MRPSRPVLKNGLPRPWPPAGWPAPPPAAKRAAGFSVKIFLDATIETRANRIVKREGGTFQERYEETAARDASDTGRYKALYGIDNNEHAFADMIIDTGLYTPKQIVDLIIDEVKRRGLK